jgi:hypothetical protein
LQDLEDTITADIFAFFGMGLEDAKDDILFTRSGYALQSQFFSQLNKLNGGFLLEFCEVHVFIGVIKDERMHPISSVTLDLMTRMR